MWVINNMNNKLFTRSFITLSLTVTLLAVYFFIESQSEIMPTTTRFKSNKRFQAILKNLDTIEEKPEVTSLFIGTSIFQYFLFPPDFDKPLKEKGIDARSYNLSFEGNFGLGFYALNKRLQSEFSGKKKFRAVILELAPSSMNRQSFTRHKTMIDVGNPDIFMNKSAWLDMLVSDPAAATYLYFNRLIKPFDWNFVGFYAYIRDQPSLYSPKPAFAGIARLWADRLFYEKPEWKLQNYGMVNWNFPEKKPLFDKFIEDMHKSENWQIMIGDYARGNGLLEVRGFVGYEESIINYYLEAVRVASKYADKVFVVKLPLAPSFQKLVDKYSDESYVTNRVTNETSAILIDYTKSFNFEDADFADAMHLKHETMQKVMYRLGEDLAPYFK